MAKQKDQGEKKELQEAVDEIKQRFGEGAIMKLKEVRAVDVDAIPTGSISLDLALGVLGIPRGRVVEVFGPESAGKTSLALHIIAEAQKQGGVGAFVDAEHALDPDYAKKIGVNVDDLLISQPDSGEQALQIVETLVRSAQVDVIVIDSVAALVPKAEIEGEAGEFQIGLQARLMSQACLAEDTELLDPLSGQTSLIKEIVEKRLPWHTLTYNTKKRKFIMSRVIDWLPQGERNCFEIKTKDGHVVNLTDDHLVLTLGGWKEVKNLTLEDCLTIPRKVSDLPPKYLGKKLTDDEIKIIAYIIGDGSCTHYQLTFANVDPEIIGDLNASLASLNCELYKKNYKAYSIRKNKNLPRGSYRSPAKELLRRQRVYGKKGPEKDIPSKIFKLSKEQLSVFISRLWSCDGHVDLSARAIIYSSTSLELIKQLQFLLLHFGIVSRWSQKKGSFPRPHPLYKLIIQGRQNIQVFANEIGLVGVKERKLKELVNAVWKSKVMPFQEVIPYQLVPTIKEAVYISGHTGQEISHLLGLYNRTSFPEFKPTRLRISREHLEKISNFIGNKGLKEVAEEGVYWSNIISISPIGKRKVYDLTVEDRPNFVANGVVVHNCRKLSGIIAKTKTVVIFLNQTRMKIGMLFGNPETTPGGLALKFYASVRIDLRRLAQIKKGDEIVGNRVRAKIVKNKVAPPFKTAEFDIYYNEGISYFADILNTGLKLELIKKAGSWLQYENTKLGQGMEGSKAFLKENSNVTEQIKKAIVGKTIS
ncbi:MAG: recombination protein RecA [Parcubacteria group bacterium Gr01-1014_30]|nr:MAG: recombination protein RecA [Parcubacteria group bacterium Gr01-1014_30]